MKITVAGNIIFSEEIKQIILDKGISHIFEKVMHIFTSSDISIANLESFFTQKMSDYSISPSYIKDFRKIGLNAFQVLNKYSYDYGTDIVNNSNINIQTKGAYTLGNYEEPATLISTKDKTTVAILGYALYKNLYSTKDIVRDIKVYSKKADKTILLLNYGKENERYTKKDRELFESFTDQVDVIIGYHPQTYIPLYIQDNTHIFPSIGNLLVKTEESPFSIGSIHVIDLNKDNIQTQTYHCILNSNNQIEILNQQ